MFKLLDQFNSVITFLLIAAYLYQVFYTLYATVLRIREKRAVRRAQREAPLHRFAALICARNEENVIAELIGSLKAQDYPSDLLDIYVIADNCTDGTADAARAAGATVYERFNLEAVGKGHALDDLFGHLASDEKRHYDAYLVFDADNIVDSQFVRAMNETFSKGYDVITSYRNSKNFDASWVSAGYSIWFLREARFLNYPRMNLHTSCAISGTGFLVSSRVIEENGGWPYFLLTEDIEFSIACATRGITIGYCDDAILYDEQPVSFGQSWRQRLRWSKGFYQVNARYALSLLRGCVKGPHRLSCYDMLMTIAPCVILTVIALVVNLFCLLTLNLHPRTIALRILREALGYIGAAFINTYEVMFLYGLLTILMEWRRIPAKPFKRLQYLPLFPVFVFSYIPISLAALFVRVEWKPISHTPMSTSASR